ncbi:hypothetical protein B0H14DRAFT_3154698 [Mycena olivaceomarginata]|nr:hypothetical protein B0H14DRAFT_3154698 [Mycena olivaceomarginata]
MASVPVTPVKNPSSDTTHSTPHSRTTAHATTLNTAPVASLQSELKKDIADEFGGHIWQFSPKRISQMLSPKHLKSAYTKALVTSGQKGPLHPRLDDHICLVDDAVVASALDGIEIPPSTSKPVDRESQSYQTLCVFLNDCGQAINSAYDRLAQAHPSVGEFVLKPREKRWYPQLHFHPNDEATADGIDSAAPLKPDIVGLHEKDFDPKALPCCWGFSAAKNPQVRIPVEVKKAWPELIWQAGTYARALRSATPERALRLVFGYNQVTCDFRVLIFHNGGLAASLPCDLRSTSGRKDVVRMLWPVFLWQDAEDAGFPLSPTVTSLRCAGAKIWTTSLVRPWHTRNQGSTWPADRHSYPSGFIHWHATSDLSGWWSTPHASLDAIQNPGIERPQSRSARRQEDHHPGSEAIGLWRQKTGIFRAGEISQAVVPAALLPWEPTVAGTTNFCRHPTDPICEVPRRGGRSMRSHGVSHTWRSLRSRG